MRGKNNSYTDNKTSEEVRVFTSCMFRNADEDGYVNFRAFDQFNANQPPVFMEGMQIGRNLDLVAQRAAEIIELVRQPNIPPSVFAPPIATFNNKDRARTDDLANGLAISQDFDKGNPIDDLRGLESVIGVATIVVSSGGCIFNDDDVNMKLHAHWLKIPLEKPLYVTT